VHRINGTNDSRIAVATLSLSEPKSAAERLKNVICSDELNMLSELGAAA
jgi:hypothetical protein